MGRQDAIFFCIFVVVFPIAFLLLAVFYSESPFFGPAAVLSSAIACVLTLFHLTALLRATKPGGLWAAMIVLMVPVYSLLCWMTMLLEDFEVWFDVFKSLYESFTLFCFLMLLNSQRGSPRSSGKDENPTRFWSVMQFVFFNVAAAYVIFKEPNLSPVATMLLLAMTLVSCSFALASVVALHHEHETGLWRDSCKFWCIKGLISTLFNQHMFLTYGLNQTGLVDHPIPISVERVLICFELLPLALAHSWAYRADDFKESPQSDEEVAPFCQDGRDGEATTAYGAASSPHEVHEARSSVDGLFGVAFLGTYSGLLVAMYLSVLKTAQADEAAASQSKKCHWYYWFRYLDHCSPNYYRTEQWLQQQAVLNHAIRMCVMSVFGVLFAMSFIYVLFKSRCVHLSTGTQEFLMKLSTRFLCVFLFCVVVPMGWTAMHAMDEAQASMTVDQ